MQLRGESRAERTLHPPDLTVGLIIFQIVRQLIVVSHLAPRSRLHGEFSSSLPPVPSEIVILSVRYDDQYLSVPLSD